MSSHYVDADSIELKTNVNDIEVGCYYTVGGVECVVVDILNRNECTILDLFEKRERKANKSRLKKIEDISQLKIAKSTYRKYLDERQVNLTDDDDDDDDESNLRAFILTTEIGKLPQDNKTEYNTCRCCHIPAEHYPVLFLIIVLIIGIVLIFIYKLYLIGALIVGITIIILCGCYFLFIRGCQCSKHENKIIFNENEKMIYLYWNNKLHQKISYNKFVRLGWHRYIWHNARSDEFYANVYVIRKHKEPIRFNWYLADRSNADKFTTKVNQFWAKNQNIADINNEMQDEYTNFMKDNVKRRDTNVIIRGGPSYII